MIPGPTGSRRPVTPSDARRSRLGVAASSSSVPCSSSAKPPRPSITTQEDPRTGAAGERGEVHPGDATPAWRSLPVRGWYSPSRVPSALEASEDGDESEQDDTGHQEPQRLLEPPPGRGVLLASEPQRPQEEEGEEERRHVPQEQGHDPRVHDDREPPRSIALQPSVEPRLEQHDGADRPDAAEQEAHGGWVGVRHRLDVGAEQALRVVADAGEPVEASVAEQPEDPRRGQHDEPGEPAHDHRPEPPARPRREGAVRVRVTELVREQQHERHVQPAPAPRHRWRTPRGRRSTAPSAIASGTHRPNRRWSRIVIGAITTTTR